MGPVKHRCLLAILTRDYHGGSGGIIVRQAISVAVFFCVTLLAVSFSPVRCRFSGVTGEAALFCRTSD